MRTKNTPTLNADHGEGIGANTTRGGGELFFFWNGRYKGDRIHRVIFN